MIKSPVIILNYIAKGAIRVVLGIQTLITIAVTSIASISLNTILKSQYALLVILLTWMDKNNITNEIESLNALIKPTGIVFSYDFFLSFFLVIAVFLPHRSPLYVSYIALVPSILYGVMSAVINIIDPTLVDNLIGATYFLTAMLLFLRSLRIEVLFHEQIKKSTDLLSSAEEKIDAIRDKIALELEQNKL